MADAVDENAIRARSADVASVEADQAVIPGQGFELKCFSS